uniref:Uncharacterized protein n=1 Tax=Rhizophora mucronata TaxID=61149 RepID=A0A2P2IZH0_RHIMU
MCLWLPKTQNIKIERESSGVKVGLQFLFPWARSKKW